MGPIMPPSKKRAESGEGGVSPLAPPPRPQRRGAGPMAPPPDEELTNLNWLHESTDLLTSFGDPVLRSVSPVGGEPATRRHRHSHRGDEEEDEEEDEEDEDEEGEGRGTPGGRSGGLPPYDARRHVACKPPYSFSCLIFMAIEGADGKRLPVKDIYGWILEHFPYFASAPAGWKNSVRHNLSLNKCFKKVDKDRSQSIGKGSLWCIDPDYRHNLILALKKTPFHPHTQLFSLPASSLQTAQSVPSPQVWQASPFYRKHGGVLLQVPQGAIQNGARISQGLFPGIPPLPVSPLGSRSPSSGCRNHADAAEPSQLVTGDPKVEHSYSTAQSDEEGSEPSPPDHNDSDSDDKSKIKKEPLDWPIDTDPALQLKRRHHPARSKPRPSGDSLPLKKRAAEKPAADSEEDEEMKEAAGSLLHLAGVRSCLNNITNRTAKGQKEPAKAEASCPS